MGRINVLYVSATFGGFKTNHSQTGFISIALQLSPLFWVAFVIRIKCLASFLEGELCRCLFSYETNDDQQYELDQYEDHQSMVAYVSKLVNWFSFAVPCRSTLIRISLVIGFTTLILQRFSTDSIYFLSRYQWIVRIIHTFAAAFLYLFALRTIENEDNI
ncbi:hypothetical protein RDWZM_007494 [Blomia tropicalis]|uniref:Uncharacterized protein n=1 Tax=Blomia tropicalis TaxID=40697 RepID=A0A9Q0LZZ2_BLOTA|nr:hypothetical protein RDWZM_007494 [Blomia tropicalis]